DEVVMTGIDKTGKWYVNDPSSFLLNDDNPKLIELNQSNDPIAIVPGNKTQHLIHAETADVLSTLDVVFSIVHGTLGEDGSLQGGLRLLNVPYVGPAVLSSSVCLDEDIAKGVLTHAGLDVGKGVAYPRTPKRRSA